MCRVGILGKNTLILSDNSISLFDNTFMIAEHYLGWIHFKPCSRAS